MRDQEVKSEKWKSRRLRCGSPDGSIAHNVFHPPATNSEGGKLRLVGVFPHKAPIIFSLGFC